MLIAATPALAQTEVSGSEIISTNTDAADRLTVPVKIGTSGPYPFMIDTGAQNTVVGEVLVNSLNLPRNEAVTVIGVAGKVSVDTVRLAEISLGKRTYTNIIAPILRTSNIGAAGILGIDSLQDQRVVIDFRKGTIAVSDAASLGGNSGYEIIVTARRRSGQLIMTDASIDGVRVDVVIDTGSDTTLANRALQAALGRRGHTTNQTLLHSVTGQDMIADIGTAEKLEMQGLTIAHIALAYADSPTFTHLKLDKRPAIFLGLREMRVFPRLAIDFKSRKVLFQLPGKGDPGYFDSF